MGSGKGQRRRVQAVNPSAQAGQKEVGCEPSAWTEFVNGNGIGKTTLHKYYFGKTGQVLAAEDYDKLLTELFSDAVAVGALVLPSPYQAEDFVFKVVMVNSRQRPQKAEITCKTNPRLEGTFRYVNFHVGRNRVLSSHRLENAISTFSTAINAALRRIS